MEFGGPFSLPQLESKKEKLAKCSVHLYSSPWLDIHHSHLPRFQIVGRQRFALLLILFFCSAMCRAASVGFTNIASTCVTGQVSRRLGNVWIFDASAAAAATRAAGGAAVDCALRRQHGVQLFKTAPDPCRMQVQTCPIWFQLWARTSAAAAGAAAAGPAVATAATATIDAD